MIRSDAYRRMATYRENRRRFRKRTGRAPGRRRRSWRFVRSASPTVTAVQHRADLIAVALYSLLMRMLANEFHERQPSNGASWHQLIATGYGWGICFSFASAGRSPTSGCTSVIAASCTHRQRDAMSAPIVWIRTFTETLLSELPGQNDRRPAKRTQAASSETINSLS